MRILSLVLIGLLLECAPAFAQSDWAMVAAIKAGSRLRVYPQGLEGTLQHADAEGLTVWRHDGAITIARASVQRIDRGRNLAALKARNGFLIGWGIGTASWRHVKWFAPVLGLGLAGIGAVFGATDGAFDYRYETIFDASGPLSAAKREAA
jgi:hypothetical protein